MIAIHPGAMGVFRKDAEERLAGVREEMRQAVVKAGVDLTDAVTFDNAVMPMRSSDRGGLAQGTATLVVRHDRVDIVYHGRIADPLHTGAGTTSIPADQIASVRHHLPESHPGRTVVAVETAADTHMYWASTEQQARKSPKPSRTSGVDTPPPTLTAWSSSSSHGWWAV